MLIEARAFLILKKFVEDVPCRQNIDFLCGLCAQLEYAWQTAAASSKMDKKTVHKEIETIVSLIPDPKGKLDTLRPSGKTQPDYYS